MIEVWSFEFEGFGVWNWKLETRNRKRFEWL